MTPASNRLFAVRVVGTDRYMPSRRSDRGFSFTEPQPLGGEHGPRLHGSRRSALMAIAAWRAGRFVRTSGWHDEHERIEVRPAPERAEIDLEVVAVRVAVEYPFLG